MAIILTPVVTWLTTLDGVNAPMFGPAAGETTSRGVAADEALDEAQTNSGNVKRDVHIASIASQESDSSMTLRLLVRNDGEQAYSDVKVRATFFDPFGAELTAQDGSVAMISLGAGEEGYVKVWAHNEYGVAQYELEIVDE